MMRTTVITTVVWTLVTGYLIAPPLGAQSDPFPGLAAGAPAGTGEVVDCRIPRVDGGHRCGVYRVYEDRTAGAGRTLDIHFVLLAAIGEAADPSSVLMFFPGGPGAQTIEGAEGFRPDLRAVTDVLLVDLRGIGRSGGLTCDQPFSGGTSARFGQLFPPDLVRACRDRLVERADLAAYTTAATVDDLDEIRAWLGYERVNLFGGSYGTRVSQVYMRRHPGAVRVAILNGVTPVSEATYVRSASLLQRSLDLLIAGCERDDACRSAHPDFRHRLTDVLARLADGPVPVTIDGVGYPFTKGDLAYAMRGLLYGRSDELPGMIDRASSGGFEELARFYLERTAWITDVGIAAGNHWSVLCAEDIAPLTDEIVRRETAGTFMGSHLIDGYRAVCELWPHARLTPEHFEPVRSDVPTLLLSGELDPVTPPDGGETVAASLARSLHVVVQGGGHGVGGPCVASLQLRLIVDGNLDRVDPSCVGSPRSGAPRSLPRDR